MKSENPIDRSLEEQLSPDEWESLQKAALADPALLKTYVEQRWIHAELLASGEQLPDLLREPDHASAKSRGVLLSAAAALLFFCSTIFLLTNGAQQKSIAVLLEAENCRWSGSELPTAQGSELTPGYLALEEGMATIRFHSGATVTLEAPTSLELQSSMRARLLEGSVVADVPESAHGFTIDTQDTEVIDLGTKFGVTTNKLGDAHVFVFEGEVKVQEESMEEAKHILAGKHLLLGGAPTTLPEPLTDEISRAAPANHKQPGWVAISTKRRSGKDTYFRRDHEASFHREPLLMVKHTELARGNQRKIAMSFDFTGTDRRHLANAKLALKLESSGLGFSSLVPDSEFAVFGIQAAGLDSWDEKTLNWSDAEPFPASVDREKLAEFTIPKGSPNNILEIESEALVNFVRNHPDDLVTIVIERLTGEFDKQGLVHAFASKEHPTSPAPTLWIQTVTP